MAKIAAKLATVDRSVVRVVALALTLIGVFSVDQSMFDVAVCLVFGLIGYAMLRYGYAVAAAALGTILGANIESTLRQGLLIANGSIWSFLSRPVMAVVLLAALALLAIGIRSEWRSRRKATSRPEPTEEETPAPPSPVR